MKSLSETWFADGYIDFELKKYTLLAYLQRVNAYFNENKLYPQLADVIFHYNNLISFRKNKQFLQEQFPKKFTGVQIQKIQLLYEQIIEDDELMTELEEIISFAATQMQATITNGTEIYEFVEDKISINPIGIVPLEQKEGYFFLSKSSTKDTSVYYYRLSIFEKHDEKYRTIKTEFINNWLRSFSNTYENIKSELIRNRNMLPNPAVYAIESELVYPVEETLLPVAKRSLVRYLTENGA
ncbi:hypothetical protein I5907_16240 [Panacibacter sp. DH6]|uniref:Uncharacterized protein n=1 Tax=Panacibacter microcysteis TaxID=2793269 RepID=A0A931EBT5_9BACT|nr:hypothetical protein [Panacibacter microcysteis]MBG9377791.1 hypothetical protein [Panacibacter microcysteis]